MKISLAFPGLASPARRALAGLADDWAGLARLASIARQEGPSPALGMIAGVSGVGPVAARALALFFREPHNRAMVDALVADKAVVVFADYDVDGASSAALLVRWFAAMGKRLTIYVPDRVAEGYGPSPAAFRRLREEGADLVVTVDCGAAAVDAIACAAEIGLDVVVVDHHLMRDEVPVCAALVNPNRPDCGSGQGVLAAAGVKLHALATWWDALEAAEKHKYFDEMGLTETRAFLEAPEKWSASHGGRAPSRALGR